MRRCWSRRSCSTSFCFVPRRIAGCSPRRSRTKKRVCSSTCGPCRAWARTRWIFRGAVAGTHGARAVGVRSRLDSGTIGDAQAPVATCDRGLGRACLGSGRSRRRRAARMGAAVQPAHVDIARGQGATRWVWLPLDGGGVSPDSQERLQRGEAALRDRRGNGGVSGNLVGRRSACVSTALRAGVTTERASHASRIGCRDRVGASIREAPGEKFLRTGLRTGRGTLGRLPRSQT